LNQAYPDGLINFIHIFQLLVVSTHSLTHVCGTFTLCLDQSRGLTWQQAGDNGLFFMADNSDNPEENDAARRQRLEDIKVRIDKLSPEQEKTLQNGAPVATKRQSIGRALRLGTDLVAGVAVGALIGFWLDRWLGTQPALFIIFFLLGTAAGFLNVFRTAKDIQEEQAEQVRQGKLDLGRDLPGDDEDD